MCPWAPAEIFVGGWGKPKKVPHKHKKGPLSHGKKVAEKPTHGEKGPL